MIALLAILSLLGVILPGLIMWTFAIHQEGQEPIHFIEGIWQSLMLAMDSGTISGDSGWSFRTVDFLFTLGWSSKIFTIIANENQKKPHILILAYVQ